MPETSRAEPSRAILRVFMSILLVCCSADGRCDDREIISRRGKIMPLK